MSDTIESQKSDYKDLYQDFYSAWSGFLREGNLDLEMHLGAHFTEKQYKQAELTGRTLIPFNKTARQVELISGYEIRNRHILKIGPVGKNDDEACRQHTALVMQQMCATGYDTLSDAFKWGSLVSGSNLFEMYLDREGTVRFTRRPHNTFLLDPSFTLATLENCRNILTGQWLHEEEVKLLLPADADKIDKIKPTKSQGRWTDYSRFNRKDYIRLYEEWWSLETKFEDFVISRVTGDEIPFKQFAKHPQIGGASNASDIIINMKMPNGMPLWSKYKKPTKKVKLVVFVDGEPVWDGDNPTGLDEYNFVWLGGEWAPECDRDELKLRSLTRKLRMPQCARDRRLNQAIDIIESQIMSGTVEKEGAIQNREELYKSGQGKHIVVDKDFAGNILEAVQPFQGRDVPPGVFNLIEILDREETETTGLNEEIFGSDDKDVPGVLARFRTGQALTGQQGLFQGFRRAKWQVGIKLVKLNQKFMNPQRIMRALSEWPAQDFYVPDFTKFDCTPVEGLLTDTQRQLWYLELKQLNQEFPGIIPPSYIFENAPIQNPRELVERIKQQEQQQMQMTLLQLQTKQAVDQLMQSEAQWNIAKTQSEVVGAGLEQAKTMTEIQKLRAAPQLEVIDRYLKLMELMQNSQNAQRQLPERR